jgi:hypothetical protein
MQNRKQELEADMKLAADAKIKRTLMQKIKLNRR